MFQGQVFRKNSRVSVGEMDVEEDLELDALVMALIEHEFGQTKPKTPPPLPPLQGSQGAKKIEITVPTLWPKKAARKPAKSKMSTTRRDIEQAVRKNMPMRLTGRDLPVRGPAKPKSTMKPGLARSATGAPVTVKRRRELKPITAEAEKRHLAAESTATQIASVKPIKRRPVPEQSARSVPTFGQPMPYRRPARRERPVDDGRLYLVFRVAEDSILNNSQIRGERGEMDYFRRTMLTAEQLNNVRTEITRVADAERVQDLEAYVAWLKRLAAAHLNWLALQGRIIRNVAQAKPLTVAESRLLSDSLAGYLDELEALTELAKRPVSNVRGPRQVMNMYQRAQLEPLDRIQYVWNYVLDSQQGIPLYQARTFNADPDDLFAILDNLDRAASTMTRMLRADASVSWQQKVAQLNQARDEIEAVLEDEVIEYPDDLTFEPLKWPLPQ